MIIVGMERHKLILPNDIATIPQLKDFVDTVAKEAGMEEMETMTLNLAIEEAVVNVMNYAYPKDTKGTVDIETTFNNGCITFVISDSGMAFDPTAKEEPDTTLTAEERPIGGLGIFLVRQFTDAVGYERREDRNILTVKKKIH